jgi:hypothetical protein
MKEFDNNYFVRYIVKDIKPERYKKNNDIWIVDIDSEQVWRDMMLQMTLLPLKVGDDCI